MTAALPLRLRKLRHAVHLQLDPAARAYGLSAVNLAVAGSIIAATALAIVDTEPFVRTRFGEVIEQIEVGFGALFLIEYCARLWAAPESERFGPGMRGRLRFVLSPAALVDLVAILATLAPAVAGTALPLRAIRLARIMSLARLGRMSQAARHLAVAVRSRRYELGLTAILAFSVMLLGATALWITEGSVQPEKFGSIPRAMWWAVVTLTTIGYGDAYPITAPGKFFAGLVAFAGVGLISLPAGILAAAFSDAVQRARGNSPRSAENPER